MLGAAYVAVAVVVACTGSDPEPQTPPNITINNFGPEGGGASSSSSGVASSSGSTVSDAGNDAPFNPRPAGPKTVLCPNGDHCPADTEVCCVSSEDASTAHCALKGQCGDGRPDVIWSNLGCDSVDDCGSGKTCCATSIEAVYWSSSCRENVEGGSPCAERGLCRDFADCKAIPNAVNCVSPQPKDFYPGGFLICN